MYRRETKESLSRICLHCNRQVQAAHTQSPHRGDLCPSIEAKGMVLHKHESFRVQAIDGWQRYPIITHVKKFTPADVTMEVLADIKSRFRPVKKTGQKPNPTIDSVSAARMMAPGITVVYQIDAAGRTARKCALPWGIGVCNSVNHVQKNFEVSVFLPTALAAPEAPWSTWKATAGKKLISFADPSWMKVNKLTRDKIPTKVLFQIWKEKKFGWHWISILDPQNDDVDPANLEFQPSLDGERDED
jgi:hypothetical protein